LFLPSAVTRLVHLQNWNVKSLPQNRPNMIELSSRGLIIFEKKIFFLAEVFEPGYFLRALYLIKYSPNNQ